MENETRKNILVVEDDLFNRLLFKKALEKNYTVFPVGDFNSAIEVIQKHHFHLLIIDLNLPGIMSGVDLLRTIRALSEYQKTPAIAITAYVGNYSSEYCLEQGFDYYIEKPFDIHRLQQLVDFAIQTDKFQREY